MNDDVLKIINDLQDLLNISYQEAYKIVDEYIYYGDVDLSDFDEIDDISQLIPKEVSLSLNIRDNKQESISQLLPRDKEVILNILNNDLNVSQLTTYDKNIILNIMNNQESISQLLPREYELLVQIQDNKRDIKTLSTKEKQVLLNILNNDTKIELLTAKPSTIDLGISNSNESVQLLDINDKELSIDIEFGIPTTPSHIDLDNIKPLSIGSISSIYHNETNVNHLNILTLSDVSTIKEIEQQELILLSLDEILNIHEFNMNTVNNLSIDSLPNIHEFNLNEINSISLDKISNISNIGNHMIDRLNINNLPNVSMNHKILKYVPYLTLGVLPNITIIDIQSIDTLQLSKLDNFKWGGINARVNRNDLLLLSLKDISDVSSIELSELDEQVIYDIPEIPNFDIQPIEAIEYDALHLDDNLDILNEIIKSDVLPPVTKEDFIKAGADPDTVNMYFNDYLATSQSYNLETMRYFFKHALTEKDRAIEAGGNYKGLYKIVTEERGTFFSFITEFYMTDLCQYDEDVGTVIIRYHSMLDGFLINEGNFYNSLV